MMSKLHLVAAFSVLSVAVCLATAGQSPSRHIARLEQWLNAVNNHEPGQWDAPAQAVGFLSSTDLELLFPYVKALVELVGQGEIKPGWGLFSGVEVELLDNLAASARRGDVNAVMKRGALLHSDIAITAQTDTTAQDPPRTRLPNASRIGPRFSVRRRRTVISNDGRYETGGREAVHWEFSRMLLDAVRPSPSVDPVVQFWYEAIAAYFADNYLLAQALHHLERAEQLFPDDSDLLFDRGCLRETFAAPRVQRLIETMTFPDGARPSVGGVSSNLRDAQEYFRRALSWPSAARSRPASNRSERSRRRKSLPSLSAHVLTARCRAGRVAPAGSARETAERDRQGAPGISRGAGRLTGELGPLTLASVRVRSAPG